MCLTNTEWLNPAGTVLAALDLSVLRVEAPQLAIAVVSTLLLSVHLCRHRLERKKPLFFITVLGSAITVNAVLSAVGFLLGRVFDYGWDIFTSQAWEWRLGLKGGVASAVFWHSRIGGLSAFVSILSALGVAFYYDLRSRRMTRTQRGEITSPDHR